MTIGIVNSNPARYKYYVLKFVSDLYHVGGFSGYSDFLHQQNRQSRYLFFFIPSQAVFFLLFNAVCGEVINTNSIVFCLTQQRFDLTVSHTRVEHPYNYINDAVYILIIIFSETLERII